LGDATTRGEPLTVSSGSAAPDDGHGSDLHAASPPESRATYIGRPDDLASDRAVSTRISMRSISAASLMDGSGDPIVVAAAETTEKTTMVVARPTSEKYPLSRAPLLRAPYSSLIERLLLFFSSQHAGFLRESPRRPSGRSYFSSDGDLAADERTGRGRFFPAQRTEEKTEKTP
jgi:hypothetical protein